MKSTTIFRGIATISYWADNVKDARNWYSQVLGIEPYFQKPDADNPAYIEYRVGDYQQEVGIIDKTYRPIGAAERPGGAVLYWHVDEIDKALELLLSLGAKEYEPLTPRGQGFITAAVIDPFGNILGVMYNPHYLEMMQEINN